MGFMQVESSQGVLSGVSVWTERLQRLALPLARALFGRWPTADELLARRVRATLRHTIAYPGAVRVGVRQGAVTLSGPVMANEIDRLLTRVCMVPGSTSVENRLHVVLALAPARPAQRREAGFSAPLAHGLAGARWLLSAAGALLVLYGVRRRDRLGNLLAPAGLALFLGVTGIGRPRQANPFAPRRQIIHARKAVQVGVPPETAFEFWSDFENYPRFLSHLRAVELIDEERSRWTAVGPTGAPASWDVTVTEYVPGAALAWHSTPGTPVRMGGRVRFEPLENGGTRILAQITYDCAPDALGQAVAAMFGENPRQTLAADLQRAVALIEAYDGRQVAERVA